MRRHRADSLNGARAAIVALGQLAVAPDVAALAADDDVDRVLRSVVADLSDGRRVDAGEAAWPELEALPVAELDLDAAAVDEVELLLALVHVGAGVDPEGMDDRVDAELGDAEVLADLAESGTFAEAVEVRDRVPCALDRLPCLFEAHAERTLQPALQTNEFDACPDSRRPQARRRPLRLRAVEGPHASRSRRSPTRRW